MREARAGERGWTPREMLVCAAARLVRPDDVVVVGLGLPQMAALLARRIHAPGVRLLLEVGVFEPEVRGAAMGIADPRMWEGARAFGGMLDVLGVMLHGGRVSLGILGALQVDVDGSINSSLIVRDGGKGEAEGPPRRFLGSGGANDIASLSGRVVVVLQHQPRKFKQAVDFLTSPGRRVRGRSRAEAGLPGRGTTCVVTDRAVIEVAGEGLALRSAHPGEDPERLLAETPIPLRVGPEAPPVTAPPSARELEVIRTELDPHGWYTGRQ